MKHHTDAERTLSVGEYVLSLMVALHTGARFGHCYQNAYPAFFVFPALFGPHGHFVEGWIVFEDRGNVVLMEHGWLMSDDRIVDPTLVLVIDAGEPVYYFPGVLRGRAELEALENELFPHVRFSDFGADGMGHPAYRAAYEAARAKASSLLAPGKTPVEVRARELAEEEDAAAERERLGLHIIVLSDEQEGDRHGQKRL